MKLDNVTICEAEWLTKSEAREVESVRREIKRLKNSTLFNDEEKLEMIKPRKDLTNIIVENARIRFSQ